MELPKVIYVETTNRCNAACVMCPHRFLSRKIMDMPKAVFDKVMNDLHGVDLSGTQLFLHKEGEPLCDENIVGRIQKAKNMTSAEIGLNTNGMLLDADKSTQILESGLDTIYFSIDGASEETYNAIRINCDYVKVKENVTKFLDLRNKLKSNIRVIMQMIVNENNIQDKDAFISTWEEYGVEFYIKEMHCYLDGGMSNFGKIDKSVQRNICEDPFRLITVLCDGSVGCCCWDYNNEFSLGNVMSSNLIDMYNGERILYMRRMQKERRCSEVTPCNRCGRVFSNDEITRPTH